VSPATTFQAELDVLARRQDVVDLGNLLHSTLATVQTLADQKQVKLHLQPPAHPIAVTVTPGVAKEMLIQILSALIQQGSPDQWLVIRIRQPAGAVEVCITVPTVDQAWENSLLHDALLMAQLLGMTATLHPPSARGGRELALSFLVAASRSVLVVEDNPGVSELYRRYLQDSPWHPTILTNPAETNVAALELQPAAIILDVLMPEVDGWTVLQSLRATPQLAHIPVIICSVINDPELALALGAAASLKKPLSRLELIEALHQATTQHSAGGSGAGSQ